MSKKVQIPKRVQLVAERMKRGEILCMQIHRSEIGDQRQYWLEPSGKPAGEWTVQRALDLGLIEPVGDGLFPGASTRPLWSDLPDKTKEDWRTSADSLISLGRSSLGFDVSDERGRRS